MIPIIIKDIKVINKYLDTHMNNEANSTPKMGGSK